MGKHISVPDMYEFLINIPSSVSRNSILNHVGRCSRCVHQLKELMEAIEEGEVWDFALPKAAASEEMGWNGEIFTSLGKYSITIRRALGDRSKGVITLQVGHDFREVLEGRRVAVKDGNGRLVLEGTIVDGEVSQVIGDLEGLMPRFHVEPVESPDR
jgi:hypothetical protein